MRILLAEAMMRNIPKDLVDSKAYIVTYVVYLDENEKKRYFYIAVRKDRILDFQKAVIEGDFDAEDFGIILEEGNGEAPDYIKEKMKLMYHCDHSKATELSNYVVKD